MSDLPEQPVWPALRRGPSDADAHVHDLMPSYLNGTIAPGEVGRVGDHLDRCAGCRAALRSWEVIAGAVRDSAATTGRDWGRDWVSDRPLARVLAWIGEPAASNDIAGTTVAEPTMHSPARDPLPPRPSMPAKRRPMVAEVSMAAVFVLVLAGIVAAFRLAPDDERPVMPGAATVAASATNAAATVGAPVDAGNVTECGDDLLPTGRAAVLTSAEAGFTPVPRTPTTASLPGGDTACAN